MTLNFFEMIRDRELSYDTAFFMSYLRMIACYYRKPIFTWTDSMIRQDMGDRMSKKVLKRLRKELKVKGFIKFTPGKSIKEPSQYTMLETIMTDISLGPKRVPLGSRTGTNRVPGGHQPVYRTNVLSKNKEENAKHIPVDRMDMSRDIKNLLSSI